MARVLVVDDEPALLRLLGTYLTRAGHDVVCRNTGGGGLEALAEPGPPFDVAVLDHWLPDMSGMELLNGVLSRAPGLPVLISSGSLMEIDGLALPPGAKVALLPKPYLPRMLTEKVEELLNLPPGEG